MKMVAGARLHRAQQRISAMRPYAKLASEVLNDVVKGLGPAGLEVEHPLLARRPEKRILLLVITSDRGLCGAFNTNINKAAEAFWRSKEAEGVGVKIATVGRRGRDYFKRRSAPMLEAFEGVWETSAWARRAGWRVRFWRRSCAVRWTPSISSTPSSRAP